MERYIITRIEYNSRNYLFGGYYRNGILDRLSLCDDPDTSETGNIYQGKVTEVRDNIGGTFIDVGSTKVFLPKTGYKCGQELPVQIVNDAFSGKLPRASDCLTVAGRYCIARIPGTGKTGFSRSIKAEDKKALAEYIYGHVPGDIDITIRTNALNDREDLPEEMDRLAALLRDIVKRSGTAACHSLLYREKPVFVRDLMSVPETDGLRITTDDVSVSEYLTNAGFEVDFYDDSYPLRSLYNIERDLGRLASGTVRLKCGGQIVIEDTEAFTTIDVNSGRCEKGSSPEETYFKVNREAAVESARQIRLRNLSGIILIDFINLKDPGHKKELMRIMSEALSHDSNKGRAVDITPLGIMEITRAGKGRTFAQKTGIKTFD